MMKNACIIMATLANESAFVESETKDVCGVASITSLILLSRSLHIRLPLKNTKIMITNTSVDNRIVSITL